MAGNLFGTPIGASRRPLPNAPLCPDPVSNAPVSKEMVYIAFDTVPSTGCYRQPSKLILYDDMTLEFVNSDGRRSGRHGEWQPGVRQPGDEHFLLTWFHWAGNPHQVKEKVFIQCMTHRHIWRAVASNLGQAAVMLEADFGNIPEV